MVTSKDGLRRILIQRDGDMHRLIAQYRMSNKPGVTFKNFFPFVSSDKDLLVRVGGNYLTNNHLGE